jgi:hypothetical protein
VASSIKFPGTGADDNAVGTRTWSNPGRIVADDSSIAAAAFSGVGQTTHYLKGTNFGFAVPAGATINGVEFEFSRSDGDETDAVTDSTVKLVKGGVVSGNNKASATPWPAGFVDVPTTYGGAADLWGLTLTDSDVNASNFGVVVSARSGSAGGAPVVDYFKLTIYYTAAAAGGSGRMTLLGVG